MQTGMTMFRGALTRRDERRLRLFTTTAGKDLRGPEIDEALEWCELYGANPFTRDIYFFVFDAKDAEKRRVVPVCAISLYRKIAARSGTFRPADKGPTFTYDEQLCGPANPRGIVDCTVTVYQRAHGEWHPVVGHVRWEERAPIIMGGSEGFEWVDTGETWPDTGKPKRRKVPKGEQVAMLDPNKKNWATMPETMLAKCAEADALRKGWPELSGMYVDGELDAANTIELTATEIIEKTAAEDRQNRLGGPRLHVIWNDGEALEGIPLGKFHDRVMEFVEKNKDEPTVLGLWMERNKQPLNDYWAADKNGFLDLKAKIEDAINNPKVDE